MFMGICGTCNRRRCPMCHSHGQHIVEVEAVANEVRSGILRDLVLPGWSPADGEDRFVQGVMSAITMVQLARRLTADGRDPRSWRDSDTGALVGSIECGAPTG